MTEEKKNPKIENIVTIAEAGPCKKKISIEVPQEKITKELDVQYNSLRKEAEVPGFRKGRAPRRLLEKRFGKTAIEQVKLKLLAEASDEAIKDNKLDILGEPNIDHEKIELKEGESLKFEFEVEVRPEFDLPKLEGIAVNKIKSEVDDEQVESEIELMQKYSGVWTPRQGGSVENGDQIIADAILKIEDVEEEEKLDSTEIFVKANGFVGSVAVEKLDELLVGAKAGDSKKISVDMPKTYFKEEYRGKKIDITINIKEIKWLKPAELNEDFLKRFGVETKEDLAERIREMLKGRAEQQAHVDISEQIYDYMLSNIKFDLPADIVADQANSLLQRQYINLLRQGLPKEKLAEQMEQLRSGSEEEAKKQLKTFFIMDKVADKLEITTTEEEINGHIAQLAMQRGQRPEQMREQMARDGSLAQFSLQVRENKCIQKLLETAKITEIEPEKEKIGKKTVKKVEKKATKAPAVKKEDDDEDKKPKKTITKKKTKS